MRHRLEALAHVAVLLAALLACKGGSKDDAQPATHAATGAAPAPAAPATPEVPAVKAADILADYKANEVKGDGKWKGKTVKVVGLVGQISKDILDHPFVTVGSGAEFEIPVVQCSLASGQEGAAANLSKGQAIAVRGTVTGLMMNVQMEDCEIIIQGKTADQMRAMPAAAPQPTPRPAAPPPPAKPATPPRKR
jgi:hypothetical protein